MLTSAGWVTIEGGTTTFRMAAGAEMMEPPALDTCTVYSPASAGVVDGIWRIGPLAKAMFWPLRRHWKARGAVPAASTLNWAGAPATTMSDCGSVVKDGGTTT